jgi:hypothetical protein
VTGVGSPTGVLVRTLVTLLAASALVASAAAAAGWTEPQELAGATATRAPVIDMNRRGDAVVVWVGGDSVFAASSSRGQAFGPPVQLAAGMLTASRTEVDLDDAGNVAVGWIYDDGSDPCEPCDSLSEACCDRLAGVVRAAGAAAFGRVRTLSRRRAQTAYFAAAAGPGGGGFIWATPDTFDHAELVAAFSEPGGRLRSTQTVGRLPREHSIDAVSLLIQADGEASLAFQDDDRLGERTRSATGRFSRVKTSARVSGLYLETRELDARGDEVAVWEKDSTTAWATRPRHGRYGRARVVRGAHDTSFALAPDGGALLAWAGGKPPAVLAAARPPGGTFGKPRRAGVPTDVQFDSEAAATGNRGRGMVGWIWSPRGAAEGEGTGEVFARPWLGTAPSGPARQLALPGGGGSHGYQFPDVHENPGVAADAKGNSIVVWDQAGRIGYARYRP